ncbi:MAG: DNA-directed RNA polymerase subunit alpha [Candidatus Nealsonbacteria bacterium CG23_combo_of_CG06-09_8_20_14_all_39_17]|uniref:DNA-directed RNA polymerase subunit alpha n=1 Tax=Candidatus Nealsonbacteria bacterium CG23_combo_of_CG06-09_8_20_14_all_39_17 TaxID=1974722 RepID=A0A2G9YU34_9BACT|nr:MAG: DNA-directed RNA polymerase subunit alpha [Candidatus Nealsonbacteria bacterium CG23_combo_of_CG06-09_8_20_14_all_39_17]PIU44205.1 MAG: DNA-directed RNA polymerase subunit alpha [Candidatus Nealsonbacteria bacterium CG07_land_8_20_14_0_80_39_13]
MISLPSSPKIVKKEGSKSIFEIEALYPGYGVTIGNSLRRVLLSSLSGAAITEVKIKGTPHEFSTIHGVLEDVVMIMLNLKQMRFRLLTQESQTAVLKVKGEKKIKASDFKFPSQVELMNEDLHIATITEKSKELEIEIKIEHGTGYSPAEGRSREKLEIGVLPLDAFFTPVKRVNFTVKNMMVGKRTDFDKLTLEIETDGSIEPEDAFYQASKILVDHFNIFTEEFAPKESEKPEVKEEKKSEKKSEKKKEETSKSKKKAKKSK